MAPDGRIIYGVAEPYRVDWASPGGARRSGPVVHYEPVPVTDDDKEAWANQQSGQAVMMVGGGGNRTMNIPRPDIDDVDWPEYKAAFPRNALNVTPEGELWVQRYTRAGDPQTFDVFDGEGNRARQVVLPEGRRLVGFGQGTLYAINVDEDDLQWLERYAR